jgi:hypothetical protein
MYNVTGVYHNNPVDLYDDLTIEIPGREGKRKAGHIEQYCISAIASTGLGGDGYQSNTICSHATVQWETSFKGKVRTRGSHLPVVGATVDWAVVMPSGIVSTCLKGTTQTIKDGTFDVHILDKKGTCLSPATHIYDVQLTVSKLTDSGFEHSFICKDGEPCGGKDPDTFVLYPPAVFTVEAAHLEFKDYSLSTSLTVDEISSAVFAGRVYFPFAVSTLPAGTPDPDETYWPKEWDPNKEGNVNVKKCPLPEATVCIFDHGQHLELACAATKSDGTYELPAPIGAYFTAVVTSKGNTHTSFGRDFTSNLDAPKPTEGAGKLGVSRMLPASRQAFADTSAAATAAADGSTSEAVIQTSPASSGSEITMVEVFHVTEANKYVFAARMSFQDQTSRVLHFDAHGSKCKLPLGTAATFEFTIPGHACDEGDATVRGVLNTLRHTQGRFLLPAHVVNVAFTSVDPPYPQVTDKSEFGYFNRLRTRTQQINLHPSPTTDQTSGEQSVYSMQYRFHPAPGIALAFLQGEAGQKKLVETMSCPTTTAEDTQLKTLAGYEPTQLTGDSPTHKVLAGQPVDASARITETIAFRNNVCTWVDGGVSFFSRLGYVLFSVCSLSRSLALSISRSLSLSFLMRANLTYASSPRSSKALLAVHCAS